MKAFGTSLALVTSVSVLSIVLVPLSKFMLGCSVGKSKPFHGVENTFETFAKESGKIVRRSMSELLVVSLESKM